MYHWQDDLGLLEITLNPLILQVFLLILICFISDTRGECNPVCASYSDSNMCLVY